MLPRADVLILGGDLAYPNPSNETYEKRLFRCGKACCFRRWIATRIELSGHLLTSMAVGQLCASLTLPSMAVHFPYVLCKCEAPSDRGAVLVSAGPSKPRCRRRRTCTPGCW